MAYATTAELEQYLGHTPERAERLLERASRLVDRALVSARYDPADPGVTDALRDAVLEQCAEWDGAGADGTEAGDPQAWSSVSAGGIRLSRGSGRSTGPSGGSTTGRLTHQARLVLQQAGLTAHAPGAGWC